MSKIAERVLAKAFLLPLIQTGFLERTSSLIYQSVVPGTCMLTWVEGINSGSKFGVYCADVAGAFDRVSRDLLERKLTHHQVCPTMRQILHSWLQPRAASVIVDGPHSKELVLINQ